MLIMTIDQTLNDIWQVSRQRPLPQRALVYWAVLTLGPVVVGASLWATSYVARESMGLVGDVPGPLGMIVSFLPVLVTGLGFTALFIVVPNRRVLWRDAALGGFGAAVVLEAMKQAFAFYLTQFPTYTVIYGTFATVPIFLLWMFMSWLVVLLGAVTAASLPLIRLGRWRPERDTGAPLIDAIAVLRLLQTAQRGFPADRSVQHMAAHLRLQYDELLAVLERLSDLGLVTRTHENRWILACHPDSAPMTPLFDHFLLDRRQSRLQDDPSALHLIRKVVNDEAAPTLNQLQDLSRDASYAASPHSHQTATRAVATESAMSTRAPATGDPHAQSQ